MYERYANAIVSLSSVLFGPVIYKVNRGTEHTLMYRIEYPIFSNNNFNRQNGIKFQ